MEQLLESGSALVQRAAFYGLLDTGALFDALQLSPAAGGAPALQPLALRLGDKVQEQLWQ